MAVDTRHPDHEAMEDRWVKMRDVVAGQERIHDKGKRYLPELSGQSPREYRAYRDRTPFYNATKRTIDGLSGMIFRREPDVERPDAMEAFFEDVTLDGLDHQAFAENCIEEVLEVGRGGILVDHPRTEGRTITRAQAEAEAVRPFFNLYKSESVLGWRVGQVGNITTLTQLRLKEWIEEPDGEFDTESIAQIRVLDLVQGESGPQYRVRLYREQIVDGKKQWVQHGDEVFPLMRGQPIPYIPFVFFNTQDTRPDVVLPPLLDLANTNLAHYRVTADLFHGAHFTGLPTAVITGHQRDEESGPLRIGSQEAWVLPEEQAKAHYLEFTGQGLGSLESLLNRLEHQMAFLGARMLAPEKKAAEAADTARIKQQGESSVLASMSMAVSGALTKACEIARDWMGLSGDVRYELNHDFDPTGLSAQELQALVMSWQQGAIGFETLFENLKRGEIVRSDKSAEEEREEIDMDPSLGNLGRDE